MKDGTGTPFIELSEKLAKAEAERDAERDSNEQWKEIIASVYASHDAWAARAKTAEAERDAARALAKDLNETMAANAGSIARIIAERDAWKRDADKEWGASATERHALKARAEAAEAALAKSRNTGLALAVELDCTKVALAAARAVAMEEAAQATGQSCCRPDLSDGMSRHSVGCLRDTIRALAPLPAGLVVVPVPVLNEVLSAERDLQRQMGSQSLDDDAAIEAARDRLSAALEALKAVKRRGD